eukprot:c23493_g2_i1 orf=562-1953(+)
MADAKDILGLPKAPLGVGSEKRTRAPKETPKKPDGVSREVYALTGGLPPVMPALDSAGVKKRQSSGKKISWQWLPFTSSARTDNLQLYHWVRIVDGSPPTGDYYFAKFNKAVDVIHYTDEEYNRYLHDPNWTRQETDQLFDLCEQYDLRFIVIADRFHPPRSVEELKNRYYSGAKAIILARATSTEDVAHHTLVKDSYNMAHEVERKRALGILLSQSRQQERDDAEVLAEAKRISEARLFAKGGEEAAVSLPVSGDAVNEDMIEKAPSTPARPGSPSPVHPPRPSAATASIVTHIVTPSGPKLPRVYLRATMLLQMVHATVPAGGARISKRVDQMLEELGVPTKPKVPTQMVCTEHLELRKEVLMMLNLQKQVQWKESELSMLRDNPYADISPSPSTPKKLHRGGDHDRVSTRATALGGDADGFPGERLGKREHKRKAPARFSETPPSPPQSKRSRKIKASDG